MLFGAGDLVSTGNDMMKWLAFNMGASDPNSSMLAIQQGQRWIMPTQCPPDRSLPVPIVGYAWLYHTVNIVNNQSMTWLAKDGGLAGFSSWMGFQEWVPSRLASTVGAFVLTNSEGALALGTKIIKILLGATSVEDMALSCNALTPDL